MSRFPRFTGNSMSLRLTLTIALNVLCIGAIVALRYMISDTFQRPRLSLPNVGDFSIANWFANRLADIVLFLLDLLRHLVQ
jgi:hypothetical protein